MADTDEPKADEAQQEAPAPAKRIRKRSPAESVALKEAEPAPDPTVTSTGTKKRGRSTRPFPAVPFEEAVGFAKEIYNFGSGQPVRRLSLFDHLQRTPDSGPSRMLITNANKYGLLKGNYTSDHLELTQEGKKACDESTSPREKARVTSALAVFSIPPFEQVYQKFINAKLPPRAALIDALKEAEVDQDYVEEGVDTLLVNLKAVGLLQTLSGADRVVSLDHLLDSLPGAQARQPSPAPSIQAEPDAVRLGQNLITQEQASFESTCFYITPIGSDDSETRKHSNLFLESIVEPAIKTLGLTVIRADQIDRPGVITRQIIEYILKARLVVADLSYSNANVFYELALRHAARLPVVQIIRQGETIPFDINQMRTIVIDNRDIYTLLPNVELYRSDLATQARRALESGAEVDTPISIYFPQARLVI